MCHPNKKSVVHKANKENSEIYLPGDRALRRPCRRRRLLVRAAVADFWASARRRRRLLIGKPPKSNVINYFFQIFVPSFIQVTTILLFNF